MKEFKTAQLRSETAMIFNEVMLNKSALISHRDRPEMVLVLKDHYEHLQYRAEHNGSEKNATSCMSFPDWMAAKNGEK